ncbi:MULTISPECIES: FKBP-type peptidyl-prolyl cis-trans isomerase [Pseudoalteromonas]|uniref:Peptidyl-prolyl cis-trans isomerase n=1 Tax=Pseudoalteromonas fuliginea TaxID=1872678 RepID=A0ABQ6RGX5_9GAMM|nr:MULTISPECIES: FKBP-type peptidyl-prolyl cis-trans isomerase [Pseudoalteromonas]KAA1154328.1 FKBP-type peptidyl-prolyl cis-trans isomerase [Pseudoalteromonas fuliginea]KAA1166928.1 FKBP-type peptidyl-prolyl cis-trans isomerase [Pseudoalteromonas fuliginea]GAA78578.1 FKBP-type peptidyl-prolyl cis-trans isomerase fkpA [Pseudoalteromonas sp. BSi20495]
MINIILAVVIAIFCFLIFKNSKKAKQQAGVNAQIGVDYLAANSKVEGIVETASGLQYKVMHKGESENTPSSTSMVNVHYHGTLIDGTVFDSSVERKTPISFGLHQVIKGWTEGLQLMSPGDKYTFYVPHQLAYGEKRVGSIPPASVLIFEVELLAIEP